MSFISQLPWVLVWIVVLIIQDMNLKKGKGFISLICIWIALVLSVACVCGSSVPAFPSSAFC